MITQNEKKLYEAKIPWISNVFSILLMIIGFFGFLILTFTDIAQILGIGLIYLFAKGLFKLLNNLNTKIYLRYKQVSIETGVLSKQVQDISINKLEGITVTQNIIGKLFNFGSLIISTGGIHCNYYISNPMEFRNKIIN
jgi:hypothetical protein